MIRTKSFNGKPGYRVKIVGVLDPFTCYGKRLERVLVEIDDEKSPSWGRKIDVNIENLVEDGEGEIRREIEKIRKIEK